LPLFQARQTFPPPAVEGGGFAGGAAGGGGLGLAGGLEAPAVGEPLALAEGVGAADEDSPRCLHRLVSARFFLAIIL